MAEAGTKTGANRYLVRRLRAFGAAFRGWRFLLVREPHARIHLLVSGVATGLAVWLRISSTEWCFLILAMGLVWTAEALNTALESLADEVSLEHRERIGMAKDLAAGGVLAAAIAASTVGVVVLGPKLVERLG